MFQKIMCPKGRSLGLNTHLVWRKRQCLCPGISGCADQVMHQLVIWQDGDFPASTIP